MEEDAEQHLGWISNCAIDEVKIYKDLNEKDLILNLDFSQSDRFREDSSKKVTADFYGSSSFDCNGLIFSNRVPQPELYQVKKSQSPIRFELADTKNAKVKIKNYYNFTDLNEFNFNWYLYEHGKLISSGTVDVNCQPLKDVLVSIPVNLNMDSNEKILEIDADLKECAFMGESRI